MGSQAGKVVLTSDPAALLPEGAESVRALRAIERFPSGDVTSAVIVATRPGGVTDADREALRGLATDVPGAGDASPPQASQSGDVTVVVVPFTDLGEDELVAAVATLRERLAALEGGGLETHLTGGAGFAADVSDVFGGINGVLLIGAAGIVLILLVVIYRSPVFWLIPFFTVLLAEGASRGTQYLLGEAGFSITGQAAGTASVLVFGAATDYALLLVARYREELERREDTHEAMAAALRGAAPAIAASAMTVVLALLTLLLARVGSSEALGPLAAAGVFLAMAFSLTLLPATLLIAGRRAFWPRIPPPGARKAIRSAAAGGGSASVCGAARGRCGSAAPPRCSCSRSGSRSSISALRRASSSPARSTPSKAPRCSPARASRAAAARRFKSWWRTPDGQARSPTRSGAWRAWRGPACPSAANRAPGST